SDILYKLKCHTEFEGIVYESKLANGLKIHNAEMVQNLYNLGVPKKDKTFTCDYPAIPEEYEWDFIRGAFEGDGTFNCAKGHLSMNICGVSPGLLDGINTLLNSHNIKTRVEHRSNGLIVVHAKNLESAIK